MNTRNWQQSDKETKKKWCLDVLKKIESESLTTQEIFYQIAQAAGITTNAIYKRLREYPDILELIQEKSANPKYFVWHDGMDQKIYELALLGMTKTQICRELNISKKTLEDWRTDPDKGVKEALEKGFNTADAKVAVSFYNALHDRKFTEVTEEYIFEEVDGVTVEKLAKRIKKIKTVPANPATASKWLSIRQPEKWSEARRIEVTSTNLDYSMDKVNNAAEAATEYTKLINNCAIDDEALEEQGDEC
jgi:hypothetical protein